MKVKLGTVGHFSVAVRDPEASAKWWRNNFDLNVMFHFEDGVGLTNENVTIIFQKGEPQPEVIDHVSFHLPNMPALRAALEQLKKNGANVEDPGDEIGPEAPGSPNMGLWFHDPDGYRWELSVQGGANETQYQR